MLRWAELNSKNYCYNSSCIFIDRPDMYNKQMDHVLSDDEEKERILMITMTWADLFYEVSS